MLPPPRQLTEYGLTSEGNVKGGGGGGGGGQWQLGTVGPPLNFGIWTLDCLNFALYHPLPMDCPVLAMKGNCSQLLGHTCYYNYLQIAILY